MSILVPKDGTVPMSTFAYVFSELVQYSQSRVDNTGDLERRLEEVGRCMGGMLIELLNTSSTAGGVSGGSKTATVGVGGPPGFVSGTLTRHTRLLDILRYIYTTVWKYLFGKQAKDLQQSNDNKDEYMISDDEANLWMGRFVSVPKDMGSLNCHAFLAGIVRGILDNAGFSTVRYVMCIHVIICVAVLTFCIHILTHLTCFHGCDCLQGDCAFRSCGRGRTTRDTFDKIRPQRD